MGRTKLDKNLSIFEKLEAQKSIDYSEYSVKQLSEVIEDLYEKYVAEKNRKVSITDIKNAQKLAVKIATTLEKMIPTEVTKKETTDVESTTKKGTMEEAKKDNENTGDTSTNNATEATENNVIAASTKEADKVDQ